MKVILGTDHTGFELKEKIKEFLKDYEVIDMGVFELNPEDDYPFAIIPAAEKVAEDPNSLGIVFGGSGQGEAIAANKVKGIKCSVFYGPMKPERAVDVSGRTSDDPYEIVKLARKHNNANILSIGVRFVSEDEAKEAIKVFLETPFSGKERHNRRIQEISRFEEKRI